MADTDIAKRAKFDIIRYAQAWEDADILVAALRPTAGDTVVSIASAGASTRSIFSSHPAFNASLLSAIMYARCRVVLKEVLAQVWCKCLRRGARGRYPEHY